MRIAAALLIVALGSAGAAGAQTLPPPVGLTPPVGVGPQDRAAIALRAGELNAQQNAAARQALFEQQRQNALNAQIQADQAVSQVQAQNVRPVLPPPPPGAPYVAIDPGQYATIPDSTLAASNARVREAAGD